MSSAWLPCVLIGSSLGPVIGSVAGTVPRDRLPDRRFALFLGDLVKASPRADTGEMTRTEQIRKARHDIDTIQSGLDKVTVVLEGAEEVALIGEEARRRAPMILLSLAGIVVVTAGVVYLTRRRRRESTAD